ncbi:MAG: radical SAM protein, partial [Bacteroidetes bacterium]|nr:radical SAM protein [Bacteroidota bacterium]
MPRILFASPCGPYPRAPVEKDPVDFFYYRNTLGQGVFRLRSFQSWYSLHYLAQNLPVPSVVLENPDMRRFQQEVVAGEYDVVAITFSVITTGRVLAMVEWLKQAFPEIDVILGGYGTAVFRDPDDSAERLRGLADHVCFGEGLSFMCRYLQERWLIHAAVPQRQDFLPMTHCFVRTSIPLFQQLVVVGALGCTYGCPFCATSSQFKRRRIRIASGRQLFELLLAQARKHPRVRSAIIYDEDFLLDRKQALEFMHCMEACRELRERPLLLTIFSSVNSIRRFTMEELIRCGIGTIYIGVESFQEDVLSREGLVKRDGDVRSLFAELHRHGINTLGSLIIGWDGQNVEAMEQDIRRFVSLNPTFYQVVPLHPVPGTALWSRMREEGRIDRNYTFEGDSIGRFTFRLDRLLQAEALEGVARTYRGLVAEGGPWPFRLYEVLLSGYRHLRDHQNPIMRARARAYRKMIPTVLPLAVASRVFFRGEGYRRRWLRAMRESAQQFPLLRLIGTVAGVVVSFLF